MIKMASFWGKTREKAQKISFFEGKSNFRDMQGILQVIF
jgi:hypothetical protein